MEEQRLNTSLAAREWFHAHRVITSESDAYGHIKILVDWAKSPQDDMAARKHDEAHVDDLARSYVQFGVHIDGEIVILIFTEDVKAAKLDPQDLRVKPFFNSPAAPVLMQTIAGDHRILALQKLRKSKPNNENYKFVDVTPVICSRSDHNKQMAMTFGGLDNLVRNIRQEATGWDSICQIHRKIETLREQYGKDFKLNPVAKAAFKAYKLTCDTTMSTFSPASIGSFFTIANTFGQLWINISTIFLKDRTDVPTTKKGKASKVKKKPLGYGWLCHMYDIPEEQLVSWTAEILAGELSTGDFQKRCHTWKLHVKLQKLTVDWYQMEFEDDADDVQTYNDLGDKFPFFKDAEFFNQMLIRFPKTGRLQTLPNEIAMIVRKKILASPAVLYMLVLHVSVRTTCVFLCIIFCLYNNFPTPTKKTMFLCMQKKLLCKQKCVCTFPADDEDH